MSLPTSQSIPVAFTFFNDGKDWQGGRNYFQSLFMALQRLPDCLVEPVAFIGSGADPASFGFPANVRIARARVFDLNSRVWQLNRVLNLLTGKPRLINRALRRHGVSISSHGLPTRDRKIRAAAWIPDFQHLHLPQFFQPAELKTRTGLYRKFVEQSDLIIVSSESARRDLARFAPDQAHKTRVLHFCALPPDLKASTELNVRQHYGLPTRYFYIPNQFWGHKNHRVAAQALALALRSDPSTTIVCSGALDDYRNPEHMPSLKDEIAKLGLKDRFKMLGVVPYQHIARLMLGAEAVINPSLFEGWSTTVEEAKALGVPLVLSDIDVHREQCQHDEAVFFDPADPQALAARINDRLHGRFGRTLTVEQALARHAHRSMAFARAYEAIARELQQSV